MPSNDPFEPDAFEADPFEPDEASWVVPQDVQDSMRLRQNTADALRGDLPPTKMYGGWEPGGPAVDLLDIPGNLRAAPGAIVGGLAQGWGGAYSDTPEQRANPTAPVPFGQEGAPVPGALPASVGQYVHESTEKYPWWTLAAMAGGNVSPQVGAFEPMAPVLRPISPQMKARMEANWPELTGGQNMNLTRPDVRMPTPVPKRASDLAPAVKPGGEFVNLPITDPTPTKVDFAAQEMTTADALMARAAARPQAAAKDKWAPGMELDIAVPPPGPETVPVEPPVPPPPAPGQLPNLGQDVMSTQDIVQKAIRAHPSVGERMKDWLMSPAVRRGPGPAHIAAEIQAARNLEKTSEDTVRAIQGAAGSTLKAGNDFDQAINELVGGREGAALKLETQFPEAWKKARAVVEPQIAEIRQNHKILQQMGVVAEDPAWLNHGLESEYAARLYLAHMSKPGKWAQRLEKDFPDVLSAGIKEIERLNPSMAKTETGKQLLARQVMDWLNAGAPMEAFQGATWAKPFKNLKAREDLPKAIRDMMGEVNSGTFRIAKTLGSQRAMIHQLGVMREVALNEGWASRVPQSAADGRLWEQIPDSVQFGPLRKMFVHPDVAKSINNSMTALKQADSLTASLLRMFKSNVTLYGGPAPWIHEFLGDMHYSVLAGGLDWTSPVDSMSAFKKAIKAHRAYSKNAAGAESADVLEALRLGAVDPGFSRAELRNAHANMMREMERVYSRQNSDLSGLMDGLGTVMEKGRRIHGSVGRAWDSVSSVMRLASYIKVRDELISQIAHVKDAGPEAWRIAVQDARREAALRVRMSFPSPHNLGKGVDKLRSGNAGFVAPFTTYLAEDARIHMQVPGRIKSEPGFTTRVAGNYALMAAVLGTAGAYLKAKNGITDEEISAAQQILPRSARYYRPSTVVLPMRINGKVALQDYSWLTAFGRLPQGDPLDPIANRVLTNALLYPVQGGVSEDPLRRVIAGAGGISAPPVYSTRESERSWTQIPMMLNRMGVLGPAAITRTVDLARQAGLTDDIPSPAKERKSAAEVALGAAGLPVQAPTIPAAGGTSPSMVGRVWEFQKELRALEQDLKNPNVLRDPAKKARILERRQLLIDDLKSAMDAVKTAQAQKEDAFEPD